jgi:two-component system sensor histidine kinase VicK
LDPTSKRRGSSKDVELFPFATSPSPSSSHEKQETRIIRGPEQVANQIISLVTRASEDQISPSVNAVFDRRGPNIIPAYFVVGAQQSTMKRRGDKFAVRVITDIQPENVEQVKQILTEGGRGINVKHIEGNIRKFAYSRTEGLEISRSLQNGQPEEIVYSKDPEFVAQLSQTFEGLWLKGIPANARIREIEQGIQPESTFVLENAKEIANKIKISCESSTKSLLFCTTQAVMQSGYEILIDAYKKALENQRKGQNQELLRERRGRRKKEEEREAADAAAFPFLIDKIQSYDDSEDDATGKLLGFKWITKIEDSKIVPVVRELVGLGVEIKHFENDPPLPFQFGLKDSQELFVTFEGEGAGSGNNIGGAKRILRVLFSNERAYVAQFESVFEKLWERGIPAFERIREIEEGTIPRRTVIIHGLENTVRASLALFSNAERSFNAVSDFNAPSFSVRVDAYKSAYLDLRRRGVNVRAITEIVKENLSFCKEILKLGLVPELRHMDGIKGNFAVTEKEFVAASTIQESSGANELIYSNDKQIVAQNQYVFDTLWNNAIPAELKIKQLEDGLEPEETRLITDMNEIYKIGESLISQCKEEVLVILVNEQVLERNFGIIQKLATAQREKNLKIRIIVPSSPASFDSMGKAMPKMFRNPEWRSIDEQMSITCFIFDRKSMFLTQYTDPEASSAELAVSSNIYTTNKQTIKAIVAIFGALWRESELRGATEKVKQELEHTLVKEERTRKQAELLQDVLTHDIRNYSQVTKLSAQLLEDELKQDFSAKRKTEPILQSLLRSVDRTNELLERAKKLGKIVSEVHPALYPIELGHTIENAMSLVKDGFPEKRIIDKREVSIDDDEEEDGHNGALVLADELLSDVFLNLYSNSIRYTDGGVVPITTSMEKIKRPISSSSSSSSQEIDLQQSYWKIIVTDEGRGIPDDMKDRLFLRYLESAKGTGLGLSIVHALVVDRYHGSVHVYDRIPGDYTKGTRVEILLPSEESN